MARQTNAHTVSLLVGSDLSTLANPRFVTYPTSAGLRLGPDSVRPDGVINSYPHNQNEVAQVIVGPGKVRVEAGAAITAGALVAPDVLGRAVASTVYAGEYIAGRALEASTGAGQVITILFYGAGGAGTD